LRILWLVPFPIWPPDNGGKIRAANLVRGVVGQGHEVDVWCLTDAQVASPPPELSGVSLRILEPRSRSTVGAKVAAVLSPLPTPAWALRSRPILAALAEHAPWDLVVLEQSIPGALVPELSERHPRWVLSSQNLEWQLMRQIADRLENPLTRLRFAFDAWKFKRLERSLAGSAAAVVAVSQRDADGFRSLAQSAVVQICPNGVDPEFFGFVDHTKPRGARLLMTGTLGYYPNLDASLWMLEEIFPLIRRRLPEATLSLVGSLVPPELQRHHRPEDGITIAGNVPDVRPYQADADVFVMPLRLGGGTRLKALEALATGLPVVSTRLGVEGLGLEERGLVALGETPAELASAVEQAVTDSALRARVVREGRQYVVECFNWDRIGKDFSAVLEGAARGA